MNDKPKTEAVFLLEEILKHTLRSVDMLTEIHQDLITLSQLLPILGPAEPAAANPAAAEPAVAAAPAAAPAAAGYTDFMAEAIIMNYSDAGEPTFKIQGKPFDKFGIRVYPEVLPALGVDIAKLKPGRNEISCMVRALNGEKYPKKVVGPVPTTPAAEIPW